ncbi:glutathione S-transferase L1-like [Salvia splendens]|uniref:glutathione S-transferase L1-like n=1 Tax=Salvia splendens TaxID=180675 RepID=UPI001C25B2AA|nr:glutathione S-transferase L1-like [Salvia splendens]XP_041996106.1 glutathione S-transferase L1-like [Salvia splendens]
MWNSGKGESLDLIRYIDQNIEGPSLFPNGPTKGEFGEKLLSVTGSFHKDVTTSLKENRIDEAGAAFDEIDSVLSNFDDGLFFLGQLSLGPYYCVAGADKSVGRDLSDAHLFIWELANLFLIV